MSPARINKHTVSAAHSAATGIFIFSFVIAALYFGREILIPLALAALLAFLLTPVVTWLERWTGRVAASLLAVTLLFVVVGAVGWVLTRQVIDLATQLPSYQHNIQTKLKSFQTSKGGRFSAFNQSVAELSKDLPGGKSSPSPTGDGTTVVPVPQKGVSGQPKLPATAGPPMPVEVVQTTRVGPLDQLGLVLGSVAGPFGTAALVLVLLVCMLLQREDLVGRVIRLVGAGNISATTRGIADAGKRVSRFLLMQLIVNAGYGVVIGVGLSIIGVPSAFVWGVLTVVLRFIPYVGAWVASGFPIALSLAVSNGWTMPACTVGLFVVVELVSSNVLEPLLYGSSTGVSSIALIIAAVFWTWIWGPLGLILATPLTVCLVVIGRHVPRFGALSVLFSDEEALAPHDELYHRLLAPNTTAASVFALGWLKGHSRTALYDEVFIPALATVEHDQVSGQLAAEQHGRLLQELRDMVEDIGLRPVVLSKRDTKEATAALVDAGEPAGVPATATCQVMCLPVRTDRDEIVGLMLAQLLEQAGFPASCLTAKMMSGESLAHVLHDGVDAVCISVAPPSTVVHARYLCGKLRVQSPKLGIVVGLWGATEGLAEVTARLHEAGANEVVTTLEDAIVQFSRLAAAVVREAVPTPVSFDEVERLAELRGLHLLDTEVDPVFERVTKKLTHVLDVPIALITFVDEDRQFFKSSRGLPPDLAEARQTPRDVSVCSHVVAANETLVVEDLAKDRRFASNRLLNERNLRFYAGAPLHGRHGHVLGSLCVLDHQPRSFSDHERRFLQAMAEEVMEIVNERFASVDINLLGMATEPIV